MGCKHSKSTVKPVDKENDPNKLKVAKTKYQASPEEYKNNNRQLNDTKTPTFPSQTKGAKITADEMANQMHSSLPDELAEISNKLRKDSSQARSTIVLVKPAVY